MEIIVNFIHLIWLYGIDDHLVRKLFCEEHISEVMILLNIRQFREHGYDFHSKYIKISE